MTFVSSDHGFAPQFLAIDASKPLVDLGLLSKPQTSNCRTATGETIGKAKACWAGGALQIYLNVVGRDPVNARRRPFTQIAVGRRRRDRDHDPGDAFIGLVDPNDWTHDGKPEGWKIIDRAFTKAEARYIPNGAGQTADMAHPTRTGDLVVFAYPPYQFDAETPGTLVAPSHFFGQHGYVPDVQDLAANVNMRATFLAGGDGHRQGHRSRPARSTSRRRWRTSSASPSPSTARARCCSTSLKGGSWYKPISIVGLNDFHGQLDPTTVIGDNGINVPVGGASFLATMFDEELASLPGPGLILAGGDNVGASPPNSGAARGHADDRRRERVGPRRHVATATTSSTTGSTRLLEQQRGRTSRSSRRTSSRRRRASCRDWVTPSVVFNVNGVKVGVIGAELQTTPELVSAGATAGLDFLAEAPRIKAESERLEALGVNVQVVVIHQGTAYGPNPIGNAAGRAVGRPDPRHRRPAPGHHGRRDDRRPHPPGLEPDARQHPRSPRASTPARPTRSSS